MLSIAPQTPVVIDDVVYVFTHRTRDGAYCFKDPVELHIKELSLVIALDMFSSGRLKLRKPFPPRDRTSFDSVDISTIPAHHLKYAEDAVAYIKAARALAISGPLSKVLPPIIAEVALSLGQAAPAWQTVRRWYRKYENANDDIRALLPGFYRRGRRLDFRTSEEETFLSNAINDLYMNKARISVTSLYGKLDALYAHARKAVPGAVDWAVPSRSTVHRRIKAIDQYQRDRARFGKRAADHKHRAVGRGPQGLYAMQVVEIDHTKANVVLIDEETQCVLGRPTVTVAIDRYTRMIVGLYIGFEPPNTYSVMQCLRNMFLPKDYMRREFPNITLDWPAFGIPSSIMVDNAFEFRSEAFREAGLIFKFDIEQQPVKQPQFKAKVERFMRTFSEGMLIDLPGNTFSNVGQKADNDPTKFASLTLREFRAKFHEWLLVEYCYRQHTGLNGGVPAQRWQEALAEEDIPHPTDSDDVALYLGLRVRRTLRRDGIRYLSLFYNSPEANALFQRLGSDREVTITVDPSDISQIIITHEGKPYHAYCTNLEYASGLNLHQHQIIRAYLRKKGLEFANQPYILDARRAYHLAAAEALRRMKARNRPRIARSQGGANTQQPSTSIPSAKLLPPPKQISAPAEEINEQDRQALEALIQDPGSDVDAIDVANEAMAPEVEELPPESASNNQEPVIEPAPAAAHSPTSRDQVKPLQLKKRK